MNDKRCFIAKLPSELIDEILMLRIDDAYNAMISSMPRKAYKLRDVEPRCFADPMLTSVINITDTFPAFSERIYRRVAHHLKEAEDTRKKQRIAVYPHKTFNPMYYLAFASKSQELKQSALVIKSLEYTLSYWRWEKARLEPVTEWKPIKRPSRGRRRDASTVDKPSSQAKQASGSEPHWIEQDMNDHQLLEIRLAALIFR